MPVDKTRSREALVKFLDYLAEKGLMARNTVQARKAAVSKILGILDDAEASDVTALDIDGVVSRFGNLHGQEYTPQSLAAYKSRLNSALEDFRSYSSNPLGFRPSLQNRERTKSKSTKAPTESAISEKRGEPVRSSSALIAADNIMPIAIRPDLTVYIQGLPFDLSEAEARKIAAVVTAMVLQ
jgi:hypothetical protein